MRSHLKLHRVNIMRKMHALSVGDLIRAWETLPASARDNDGNEIEKNKDAIKKTFFKLLYSERDKKIAPLEPNALPTGWTWEMLLDAVLKRHAPIGEYFQSGIAPKMQRIDSDIAEDVMLSMRKCNILVLPIHDSFRVRRGCFIGFGYGFAMLAEVAR